MRQWVTSCPVLLASLASAAHLFRGASFCGVRGYDRNHPNAFEFLAGASLCGFRGYGNNHHNAFESLSGESLCGVRGHDKNHPNAFESLTGASYLSEFGCGNACAASSQCSSFAIGARFCLLYTSRVVTNFQSDSDSPFLYYDGACAGKGFIASTKGASSSTSSSRSILPSGSSTSSASDPSSTSSSTSSSYSASPSGSSNSPASVPSSTSSSTSSSLSASPSGSSTSSTVSSASVSSSASSSTSSTLPGSTSSSSGSSSSTTLSSSSVAASPTASSCVMPPTIPPNVVCGTEGSFDISKTSLSIKPNLPGDLVTACQQACEQDITCVAFEVAPSIDICGLFTASISVIFTPQSGTGVFFYDEGCFCTSSTLPKM